MNIYCIIFMCTFGANNTDTEMLANNSLIGGPSITDSGKATTLVDVASMILPGKGEPVPQTGDIVMDLPNIPNSHSSTTTTQNANDSTDNSPNSNSAARSPTLSDILLPPSSARHHHKHVE